jgi:hypothetical protein
MGSANPYRRTTTANIGGAKGVLLEKTLPIEAFMLIAQSGMLALSRVLWRRARYMGNESLALEEVIDDFADELQIKTGHRFWRRTS